jgi:hypothetical protein
MQHAPPLFFTRRSAAGRALVPLRNAQPGGTRHAAAILAGPKRTTPALGTKKKKMLALLVQKVRGHTRV